MRQLRSPVERLVRAEPFCKGRFLDTYDDLYKTEFLNYHLTLELSNCTFVFDFQVV